MLTVASMLITRMQMSFAFLLFPKEGSLSDASQTKQYFYELCCIIHKYI